MPAYSMARTTVLIISLILMSIIVTPIPTLAEDNESEPNIPIIKIGFLNPITGPASVYAGGFEEAANIAIDMVNYTYPTVNFELVIADSGCDADVSSNSTNYLVGVGVVAVAGAACDYASMAANGILSAAGIPQVSYASGGASLSDDAAYPDFFRIVPSNGLVGNAIFHMVNNSNVSNPAILYGNDASADGVGYNNEIANSFNTVWTEGGNGICTMLSFTPFDSTNITSVVQQLVSNTCDSVVISGYQGDTSIITNELNALGFTGTIFGSDGTCEPSSGSGDTMYLNLNCVKRKLNWDFSNIAYNVTNPYSSYFMNECNCSTGLLTTQAFDAVHLIADSIMSSSSYSSLSSSIYHTGQNRSVASGILTFYPNGDSYGAGYDICEIPASSQQTIFCNDTWGGAILPIDSDGDGYDDNWEQICFSNHLDSNETPVDSDGDGVCDHIDYDSDNDGVLDNYDTFPIDPSEWIDTDGDGIGNNEDLNDDNDGWTDTEEIECNTDPQNNLSVPDDYDSDHICDIIDDDDDNDGFLDIGDVFPYNSNEWLDYDYDGIGDNSDSDDDNDGFNDMDDDFQFDSCAWRDTDMDGNPDIIILGCSTTLVEDQDDDDDGWSDVDEYQCYTELLDNNSVPIDTDGDSICDPVDDDDDDDGYLDGDDAFPLDRFEWLDTDSDGTGNNADLDDDGDLWGDSQEIECGYDPLDLDSTPLDTDLDNWCNELDHDDDGDSIIDEDDPFPLNSAEWSDIDADGIGDNTDTDDDGDGWTDSSEVICSSDPLDKTSSPTDFDGDEVCDAVDMDDDDDGHPDASDIFPFNQDEWLDTDQDGVGNNEDEDDDDDTLSDGIELQLGTNPLASDTDGDGFDDANDALPLDPSEWSDLDEDGVGDNSDAFPTVSRYQTYGGLLLDVAVVSILIALVAFMVKRFTHNKSSSDEEE